MYFEKKDLINKATLRRKVVEAIFKVVCHISPFPKALVEHGHSSPTGKI